MTPTRLLPLLFLLLALLAPCVVAQDIVVTIENQSYGEHYQTTATLVNGTYIINMAGIPNVPPSPVVTPSPITYPQEYYTLGSLNDVVIQEQYKINIQKWDKTGYSPNIAAFASLITSRELRRQTILMERQNEMLAEQMRWQRNATLNCVKWAPSHYGEGCQEYAWVGADIYKY